MYVCINGSHYSLADICWMFDKLSIFSAPCSQEQTSIVINKCAVTKSNDNLEIFPCVFWQSDQYYYRNVARKSIGGLYVGAGGGLDIWQKSTNLQCFNFQFGGLEALFGGLSPPKSPWRRDCTTIYSKWLVALGY